MALFLEEYEKLRLLGRGSFASVFKVRHHDLGYTRAIKVSNELIDEGENDHAYQTFLNECRVLLRLGNGAHPNIVRIYQPRLIANKAIVEMDYVDGETLNKYIASQGFIPYDEFCRFALQVVGAMAYCHVDIYKFLMEPDADELKSDPTDGMRYEIDADKEAQLIAKYGVNHNDLHSNNIMRRHYDGSYVLLDFGLAIQDGHCVKSSARGDGAYEYCSPEKLRGNEKITAASDVYSLGVLLFEMLAGRVPFQMDVDKYGPEGARFEVYKSQLNEEPPAIEPLRRKAFEKTHPGQKYECDYPEALDFIISRCLRKSPADRYPNAKALLMAIKQVIAQPAALLIHASSDKSEHVIHPDLDNEKLQQQVDNLKNELNMMRRSLVNLKGENQSLRVENSGLQSEINNLRSALSQGSGQQGNSSGKSKSTLFLTLSFIMSLMTLLATVWLYVSKDYWRSSDAQWDMIAIIAGGASILISLIILFKRRVSAVIWSLVAILILMTAVIQGLMTSFDEMRWGLTAVTGISFLSFVGAMFSSRK